MPEKRKRWATNEPGNSYADCPLLAIGLPYCTRCAGADCACNGDDYRRLDTQQNGDDSRTRHYVCNCCKKVFAGIVERAEIVRDVPRFGDNSKSRPVSF